MKFIEDMKVLLSSNNFLIYVTTIEEEKLEHILSNISKELFKNNICIWNFIDGYTNNPSYVKYGQKNPLEALSKINSNNIQNKQIFFLKDFSHFMKDISINRKLKNLYTELQTSNKYIIMSGTERNIPYNIQEYITCIELPLTTKHEIHLELRRLFQILDIKENNLKVSLLKAYTGFSINKVRKSLSEIITNKTNESKLLKKIQKEKKQFIQKTKIAEFYSTDKNLKYIGGLKNLKHWLQIRKLAFSKKAKTYGITIPKGILLVGVQGTGKSLSAKAIAMEWELPLLKLNISEIFTGILGESEKKVQDMINICEQISPCVLWIDEIDKIFTDNNNINDSGTSNRITNIFLTWLSEDKKQIFVVATANTTNNLPIEILRKGRLDEIFFIDLPTLEERINIFQVHLKKVRPLTWSNYNLYYLAKITKQFSGAEIEQAISEAMYFAFNANREFSTKDITKCINEMIPLAITEKQKISKLRRWGYSGKVKIG
uniref:Uncharacterized AAA domain-containing protein ycf46 n=1 Tax=Kuetzingia canaliculata TaxID=228262 RepID=A0A1Z1MP95_KUECA|nr:hypothetical protein [Kuetzingia canaliculata]ARW67766.1 hypothetical protein [Kuetzingia canaliculata]